MNAVVVTRSRSREDGKWDLIAGWFGNGETLISSAKHYGSVVLTDCFFSLCSHTRTWINQMGIFSSSILIHL